MRFVLWTVALSFFTCSCEPMTESEQWPFEDAPNTAVFTTKSVTSGDEPILHVSHDADDGAWQFLGLDVLTEESASIVGLKTILGMDKSIGDLADLPLGWHARRDSVSGAWRRSSGA